MKRLLSLFLAFIIFISLCACEGNWETVNLQEPISIPENGVIAKSTMEQIRTERAIAVMQGKSGEFSYEWTIFGNDLSETKEINLGVQVSKTADGNIQVVLNQAEDFGFSAMLSIYLNEKWDTQGATAYAGDKAVAAASVTGSKTTILNLTLDGSVKNLTIRPDADAEDKEDIPSADTTQPTVPTGGQNGETSDPQQNGGKDKYQTDPIPEGKPKPVEPEDQNVNTGKTYTCTFSIECATILNNLSALEPDKLEIVPSNGVILPKTVVTFYEGESVFDVLQRICRENGIHLESEWTPIYNSAYIEGIHNLYEFDCGSLSGWMYRVNGWYPNYGCSRYQLAEGDVVEWRFTCDLGNDIGGGYAVGG